MAGSVPARATGESGFRLEGTVRRPDGAPVAGAGVRVSSIQPAAHREGVRQGTWRASTDGEGRFSIEAIAAPEVRVWLSAEGYLPRAFDLDLRRLAGPVDWLFGEGWRLDGTARDAASSAPIGGARVMLRVLGQRYGATSRATTNADGGFVFYGIPPGSRVALTVEHEQYAAAQELTLAGESTLVDLYVPAGLRLAGRVLDERGEPVDGARVRLLKSRTTSRHRPWRPLPASVESDAEGRFEITGIAAGDYVLEARAEGFAELAMAEFPILESVGDLTVRLVVGRTIRGRFSGLPDRYVADVSIHARSDDSDLGAFAGGTVEPDGAYRIDGIGFERGIIQASSLRGTVLEEFEFGPEERVLEIPIDFPPVEGLTLAGRLLIGGEPSTSDGVRLHGPRVSLGRHNRSGDFLIEGLVAGDYVLEVLNHGPGESHLPYLAPFRLDGDREIELELERFTAAGRVVDADGGAPVAEATVRFFDPAAPEVLPARPQTRADGLGRFRFAILGERERVHLAAHAEGYSAAFHEVTGVGDETPEVVLALERSRPLLVVVRHHDGRPVEELTWAVLDGEGRVRNDGHERDGDGEFRIGVPTSGRHTLLVWGYSGRGSRRRTGSAVRALAFTTEERLEIELAAESCVNVYAGRGYFEREGWPWFVELLDGEGRVFRSPLRPLESGRVLLSDTPVADVCTIGGVAEGSWTARLTGPDGRSFVRELEVAAGRANRLTVE